MSKRGYNFSLNNRAWDIDYSRNIAHRPFKLNNGWYFNFPEEWGAVSYVQHDNQKPLSLTKNTNGLSLYMRVQIIASPDAFFFYKTEDFNTCEVPGSTRFILNKNMYGNYNRWFSSQSIKLENGVFELEVPLSPEYWTSVYGDRADESKKTRESFKDCLLEPIKVGIVFGGGCFYGHGIRMVPGSAQFRMLAFGVRD